METIAFHISQFLLERMLTPALAHPTLAIGAAVLFFAVVLPVFIFKTVMKVIRGVVWIAGMSIAAILAAAGYLWLAG